MSERKSSDAFERASNLPISEGFIAGQSQASPLESAISVEFDTGSLPVAQAKAKKFIELMSQKLKAELSRDVQMLLFQNKIDLSNLTLKQLDAALPLRISFKDGSIEYDHKGKHHYVQVTFITIHALGGSMQVGANGTTDDAEKALAKAYECIFESADMSQQWANATDSLIAKGYATSSVEKLDGNLQKILSEKVASVFDSKLSGNASLVSNLGVLPLNTETGKPYKRAYNGVVKLGQLVIEIIRFDNLSGDRYETKVAIRPKTKADAGVGNYVITSELDYKNHQELVAAIKEALK